MGAPFSAPTRVLFEFFGDGEWYERERVLSKMIEKVPPGHGYRKREQERLYNYKKYNGTVGPRRYRRMSETDLAFSGARSLCRELVNGQVRAGRVQRCDEDGRVFIRVLYNPLLR